jgi:hypothetical protein
VSCPLDFQQLLKRLLLRLPVRLQPFPDPAFLPRKAKALLPKPV